MSRFKYVDPPPFFFGKKAFRCEVRPRYSAGSPAVVPDHIALHVAEDEQHDYEHVMAGVYGDVPKRRAELLGLRGISYAMAESGSGRKFRWLIFDLVTGECFRRHHDSEIERLGFTPYAALPDHAQRAVMQTGNPRDYERTFWKFEALKWVQYQPELVREP